MNDLIKKSNEAIRSFNDVTSVKLLKEWEKIIAEQKINSNNPELFKKIQKLMICLRIAAFPSLPENEQVQVLKNNYLESFDIEIPMDNRLTVTLFYWPDIYRDELRKKFKKALQENQQRLGQFTIGQWIQEFEKSYPVSERKLTAAVDFVRFNKNVLTLGPGEKSKLKEIIHTYDYLLVTTLPATGPALENILKSMPESETQDNFLNKYASRNSQVGTINSDSFSKKEVLEPAINTELNLTDALKKYPDIGEQLITSNRIKLKNFPDPVRPSLKNWLTDYTFNTGYDSHSSMDRNEYLFQNQNAKSLNSFDRQRLAYVLKAYDENSLISINSNTKQIVFPSISQNAKRVTRNAKPEINNETLSVSKNEPQDIFQKKPSQNFFGGHLVKNRQWTGMSQNAQRITQNAAEQKPSSAIKYDANRERLNARNNTETAKMEFSSPQKMPFEKRNESPKPQYREDAPPSSPQPMKINPGGFVPEEDYRNNNTRNNTPPKNIVNLKE